MNDYSLQVTIKEIANGDCFLIVNDLQEKEGEIKNKGIVYKIPIKKEWLSDLTSVDEKFLECFSISCLSRIGAFYELKKENSE